MIHIGKEIEKELERQGMRKKDFAAKLGCERCNVYKIIDHQNIDASILYRISCILNHNFFAYYSDNLPSSCHTSDLSD